MLKIKDLFLSSLNESLDNFDYIDSQSIENVVDVEISKEDNFIKISFVTTFGKEADLVCDYDKFVLWYSEYKKKGNNMKYAFKNFVKEFIQDSEKQDVVSEIIDDSGNIMSSDDTPNNSTNRMVGANLKWDLERVYRSKMPSSSKLHNYSFGYGFITW